jgi:hypothetical protein
METREHESHSNIFETFVDFCENKGYTLPVHLSDCSFQIKQRDPKYEQSNEVRNEKNTSSVFINEVREPPKGAETDGEPDH